MIEIVEGRMCSGCEGNILKITKKKFDPFKGRATISPGGDRQFIDVIKFKCESCGISYELTAQGTVGIPDNKI